MVIVLGFQLLSNLKLEIAYIISKLYQSKKMEKITKRLMFVCSILAFALLFIEIQPLQALAQSVKKGVVFNPPSNIRISPNGTVICSVETVRNINIYDSSQGWYVTDACGKKGYIHNSQIRFQSNALSQSIPARFHGKWAENLRNCGKLDDTNFKISANRVDFWESFGSVRSVKLQGTSDLYIMAQFSGEGEIWTDSLHFRLSKNQKALTIINNDGSQFTRYRCR